MKWEGSRKLQQIKRKAQERKILKELKGEKNTAQNADNVKQILHNIIALSGLRVGERGCAGAGLSAGLGASAAT